MTEARHPSTSEVAGLLKMDKKSTISLIKNLVHHDRSKHIDTGFHLIREFAHNGQIDVEFIITDEQLGGCSHETPLQNKVSRALRQGRPSYV